MWWVKYFANEKSSLYVNRVKYVNCSKKTILETKIIIISNYIAGLFERINNYMDQMSNSLYL